MIQFGDVAADCSEVGSRGRATSCDQWSNHVWLITHELVYLYDET